MTRRAFFRLDPSFVAAVREQAAHDWPTVNSITALRKMPWHGFEQIYVGTGDSHLVAREGSRTAHRLQRLADAIKYEGPIFGEAIP